MSLVIERVDCRTDNYVWLLREGETGAVAAVDPSDAEPVARRLDTLGWRLTHILNTHHHGDHTGGNLALKEGTGCVIVGPAADRARIPGIDIALAEGERYRLGAAEARLFDIPGHTRGHIAFWFAAERALFCGDTMFALGCGRLFEGTPAQMWSSLLKLRALPDDTRVYCAHEYTQANARFAITIDSGNTALRARKVRIDAARSRGEATIPSLLGEERATNPFLRADQPALQAALGRQGADPVAVFAEIRARKDRF